VPIVVSAILITAARTVMASVVGATIVQTTIFAENAGLLHSSARSDYSIEYWDQSGGLSNAEY
jgi:hypothetical protein